MYGNDRPKDGAEWVRSVTKRLADLESRLRGTGRAIAAGNGVLTTDVNGRGSFLFGRTFAEPPVVTLSGGNGERAAIYLNTITTTGFTAVFTQADGSLIVSGPVRLNWIATPHTT